MAERDDGIVSGDTPTELNTPRKLLSGLLLFLLVLFVINGLVGGYHWLPARDPAALLIPFPEATFAAGLVILLATLTRRALLPASIAVGFVLALSFSFGVGEAFYQFVYREHFSMWRDARFLPSFLEMVTGSQVVAAPGLVVATIAILIGLLTTLFATLVHRLARLALRPGRPVAVTVVALLILGGAFTNAHVLSGRPAGMMLAAQLLEGPRESRLSQGRDSQRASRESTNGDEPQLTGQETETEADPQAGASQAESSPSDYAFPALEDEDVHIFIIESYGHTLFTRSDHYELISATYDRLGAQLREAGFDAYSHFMKSPAFGGRSWLADATMLSGRWIGDQATYDAMWESDTTTLVQHMERAGYYSLLAAPGMTYLEEGFSDFFPYDDVYLQGDFGYEGKHYSFGGGLTDQFMVNRVRLWREDLATAGGSAAGKGVAAAGGSASSGSTSELVAAGDGTQPAGETKPFFGVYVMVSSHVPFNVLPPFIDDWEAIGDGEIYQDLPRRIFENDWLRGGEYPKGYTESIEYSLSSVVDYLTTFVDDGTLAVIIGDHQPRIPIAEQSSTFSVPVHVVSRNKSLVRRFEAFGFEEGFEPSQPTPHPTMDELPTMLLEAAGGGLSRPLRESGPQQ